jgi:uncharacterized protein YegJ (DUF2314 family)
LGAISTAGVIESLIKETTGRIGVKEEKANDTTATVVSGRVDTRTEHFLAYISNVMDVLDCYDIKGFYLVMDNDPMHTLPEYVI